MRAHALVDAIDAESLNAWRWSLAVNGYVVRGTRVNGRQVTVHLARQLLGLAPGEAGHVDHVNGDRLDNRRENLRLVTQAENNTNVPSRGGTSRHRGVCWDRGRWLAQAHHGGRRHYLGRHRTEEAAADAVRAFWAERGVTLR